MRFCGQCGAMLAPPAPSAEERKLVTVLFADVVGSTARAGAVDTEQVRRQMSRFFEIANAEIRRYGGTVEKFIGDAVMAVFGLPLIHEDDPERAARTAAALKSRVAAEVEAATLPEIRIGMNTGEVVADPQATDKGEFLVTGEVVNLAARLQQHAQPGQVLLGERTVRALGDIAYVRPVTPLTVKGASAPLLAWELLGVAPPRERTVRATPFVGRAEELDMLLGHARRIRRGRRGFMISILGPAGVGKTRLVRELCARIEGVRVLRGRALPYGTGVPFWALGEVIREESGILMGDPLNRARRKLRDTTDRLGIPDVAPALLAVLGLGPDGHGLPRDALFSGVRAFFQAVARTGPLLMIVEDVHSAEDVTLDFFEQMTLWVRETPVLLLVLARPELLERRPMWVVGTRTSTTLFLDPLLGEESRALVQGILDGKPAPGPLVERLLERSEGNVLFVEEMLRSLLDRGALTKEADRWVLTVPLDEMAIPDTVHAVIAARIDALPGSEKLVLQTASVMGQVFWLGAVRVIAGETQVDDALWALVVKNLLVLNQRSALEGEEEFSFRNILIRDVAYAMQPKSVRWPKHLRAAEWMQEIGGDRQDELADVIAYHWLQVMALREDLGLPPEARAREHAIANLLLAGDRAAALYANTTALDHFTRALELEPPPTARLRVLLGRGEVRMLLGQHEPARDDFAAVRALAREADAPRWEAIALDRLGYSYGRQDQITQALEHLEPALTLSRAVNDPSLTGRVLNHMGFAYFHQSKHGEAFTMHEEARRLLDACGDTAGLAESLHGLGDTCGFLGRFQEAIEWYQQAVDVSERIGHRSLAGESRYMIAWLRKKQGAYADAQAEAQRSVAELTEIGDVWNASFALTRLAEIANTLGQFGDALKLTAQSLGLAREIDAGRQAVSSLLESGTTRRELEDHRGAWAADREAIELAHAGEVAAYWMPLVLSSLALDSAGLGRASAARSYIEYARRALAEGPNRADYRQQVTYAQGRVQLTLEQPADARATADHLLDMAVTTETLHWRVPAMLLAADASAALGDPSAARVTYELTAADAERLGLAPALWRALAGLAEVQRVLGQAQASVGSATRAREIIDRLTATVADPELRATFQHSAKVQRVTALAGA
ncbi:MAG TPA: tetratricopeptide repeat protein [bacterium]|nr:tetratricopeptide repeat protein [bacterium]